MCKKNACILISVFRNSLQQSKYSGLLYIVSHFSFLESSDDDDDIDDILEGCEVPNKNDEETIEEYFERTKDFWIEQSKKYFENEEMRVTTRTVTKFAKEMCQEYVKR